MPMFPTVEQTPIVADRDAIAITQLSGSDIGSNSKIGTRYASPGSDSPANSAARRAYSPEELRAAEAGRRRRRRAIGRRERWTAEIPRHGGR